MNDKLVLALGFFDGLHIAHRHIIDVAKEMAIRKNAISGAITFAGNIKDSPAIYDCGDRVKLLQQFIEKVIVFDFSDEFSRLSPQCFLEKLLSEYNVCGIVCGYDYSFGKNAEGNSNYLIEFCAERGIECTVIPKMMTAGEVISTSLIKKMIANGQIEEANTLLGEPYFIRNKVIRGRGEGHMFGFPTANIMQKTGLILPKHGVYSTMCDINGCIYKSVTNIGPKPTFNDVTTSIETFISNFSGDIYSSEITIYFIKYLRGIKKFADAQELYNQIQIDIGS